MAVANPGGRLGTTFTGKPIVQGNLGARGRPVNFRNSTKTPGNFGRLAAKLAAQNQNGQ